MKNYLVHFAQFHLEFRLPELDSLARLENIEIRYNKEEYSDKHPFLKVQIANHEQAERLIQRSILIKDIIELWAAENTFEELKEALQSDGNKDKEEYQSASFKFHVEAFEHTLTMAEQISRIEDLAFLGFNGPIDLKTPKYIFTLFEDYSGEEFRGVKKTLPPVKVYFGLYIGSGNREIVSRYDLKKREYLGTTSMDAELSLVMANQVLARPGSLILDPFVGTGSFLVSCSHFGAFTVGSDIDGRQIRGNDGKDINSNLSQYNLEKYVLGTFVCDIAHHPWRNSEWLDGIICDPPYGVRAGARKITHTDKPLFRKDGTRRYPTTEAYEMSLVISDLIQFAATFLVPSGRLVFWLPTLIDEYVPDDIPTHPKMKLISNSEQNFGKWSRRLITMEKIHHIDEFDQLSISVDKPGHSNFREKYFTPTS
ncbi:hypothetical protein HDV06_004249 [Boothiomyces sp. JEL0866]|nr:hypothetical protein HDV06_004249 [Boothiomyces sp. JEL0866]